MSAAVKKKCKLIFEKQKKKNAILDRKRQWNFIPCYKIHKLNYLLLFIP